VGGSTRAAGAIRYFDLVLLVAALPVFLAAGLPMLGYAALAAAWLVQLAIELFVQRRDATELATGNRRAAMGWVGASTLGRVWLVALVVLLVGLLGDRDDGLAAAVLAAVLFTVHFAGRFIAGAIASPAEEPSR
jgi:hypothetical protein